MIDFRRSIERTRKATRFGLILGTLGRQGNVSIFSRLQKLLTQHHKEFYPFLMAEINPKKLLEISEIEVSVCVNMSIYIHVHVCSSDCFLCAGVGAGGLSATICGLGWRF